MSYPTRQLRHVSWARIDHSSHAFRRQWRQGAGVVTAMSLSVRQPPFDDNEALPALLRPNDVARLFAVSRAWVYEAARTGRIPSVRLGGDDGPLRFIASDLERWLADARAGWHPGRSWHSTPAKAESATAVPIGGQQSLL